MFFFMPFKLVRRSKAQGPLTVGGEAVCSTCSVSDITLLLPCYSIWKLLFSHGGGEGGAIHLYTQGLPLPRAKV